jgi:hypothetical protein
MADPTLPWDKLPAEVCAIPSDIRELRQLINGIRNRVPEQYLFQDEMAIVDSSFLVFVVKTNLGRIHFYIYLNIN